ncbi:MAG TPA: winged helix-turn-helix domain-containing protein [Bryobacteraceae bacterium]|jgi:DNA-binding response OmpR family regulator|nr:winged helix-turn-helix domain-containing protein [Bryobacteraceae bacterium]
MGTIPTAVVQSARYQDLHLELDFEQKAARLDVKPMPLTRKEYELLALLVLNAGDIVTREALLMRVWGYGSQIRTRTLDVHIRRLRKKLGNYADQYIETIFGIGYRFQPYRAARVFHSVPVAYVPVGA